MQLKTRSAGDAKNYMQHHARIARRYSLKHILTFTCGDAKSMALGETENISSTGVLFQTDQPGIEVGAPIHLQLHLPTSSDSRTIVLEAEGTVRRIERPGTMFRIAAEIRFREEFERGLDTSPGIQ